MAGRYGIPGYFDNVEVSGNRIKEPGFLGKTLYVVDGTRIREPGFGGKTILVIEKGRVKEPGFLGRTLFYIDKTGAIKETGLFGRTVGAFPLFPGMGPSGSEEPIHKEEPTSYNEERIETPKDTGPSLEEYAKQMELELGYVADMTNVRSGAKTISVPAKFKKLTAIAPALAVETVKIHSGVLAMYPQSIHASKQFIVEEENPVFSSENGILYNKEKTLLIRVPTELDPFNFRDGVTVIGNNAFAGFKGSFLNIPNSVTKISKRAFECCFKMKAMFIPKSVTEIEEEAFSYNSKLIVSTEWEEKPKGWKFDESQVKEIKWGVKN